MKLVESASSRQVQLPPEPSEEDFREVIEGYKGKLCGRRIAEEILVPYLIASPDHGDDDVQTLEKVLKQEFEGSDLCVETRSSECSRLRGGCKGER